MRAVVAIALLIISVADPAWTFRLAIAADAQSPLKPAELEKALYQPVVARFEDQDVRPLLTGWAADRRIGLWMDRRVDPGQLISWKIDGEPFLPMLERRSEELRAVPRMVGQTLFLGPEESTRKLRTLIALRREELRKLGQWPASRRIDAQSRRSIAWDDAEPPGQLLQRISDRWKIPVDDARQVPDDLWASGSMQHVDAVEAFSLLLIQFDRTFAWRDKPPGISIVSIPQTVSLERRYVVPRNRLEGLMDQLATLVPDADCTLQNANLTVRGMAEDHDAVASLLQPTRVPRTQPGDAVPLKDRRFTLTARKVTIADALSALEAQGITIEYDADALAAANIRLDQRIDLELQMVPIEELLRSICRPAGLRFRIDGLKIVLEPDSP